MLAQNFKPAADLGITEPQKEALMKTLVLLETGKLVHDTSYLRSINRKSIGSPNRFNMRLVFAESDCGTVGCICGIAESLGGDGLVAAGGNRGLNDLFMARGSGLPYEVITPSQAAIALRSYLTIGDAKWHEAVA
jgi:hypothetical protein